MTILLSLLIIGSCIYLPNGQSPEIFKEVLGQMTVLGIIALWVWKYNKYIAMFLIWTAIRVMLPPANARSMETLINVSLAVMLYMAVRNIKVDIKVIYKTLGIVGLIQIATVFLQRLNLFPFFNTAGTLKTWGLMGNSNFSGALVAMILPIYFELAKEKKIWLLGIVAGLASLFILDSQFALIAGVAGVLFYTYILYRPELQRRTWILWLVFISILFAIGFVIASPYKFYDDRFYVWHKFWTAITYGNHADWSSYFTYGFGLGATWVIAPMFTPPEVLSRGDGWYQCHNEYLQVLVEWGFIGFSILILGIIDVFRKINVARLALYACLFAFLIDSIGFFTFRCSPISFLAVIYVGLIQCDTTKL